MEKPEPFGVALTVLRAKLTAGDLTPGARVNIKLIAEDLKLSATPVREALSRLAGEGLLADHRGEGFFVPWPSVSDIVALYRLSEHSLLIAQAHVRPVVPEPAAPQDNSGSPSQAVERLFDLWASEAESLVVTASYRAVSARLALARRLEPQIIADGQEEAAGLLSLASPGARGRRPAAIRAYHRRRITLAPRLARAIADLASRPASIH